MQFKTWSFAKAAVGLGFAGLLLAGLGSLLVPNEYVSQATVQIQQPEDVMSRLEPLVLSRVSLAGIINDPTLLLYKDDLKTKPLEDVIEQMQRSIHIDAMTLPGNSSPSGFHITFIYPDARKAQQTVAALIQKFGTASDEVHLRSKYPREATRPTLDVVDTPNLPVLPIHSNIWLFELIGTLFGVSAILGWKKIRKRPLTTWRVGISAIVLGLLGFVGAVLFGEYDRFDGGHHLVREQWRSTALMSAQNMTPEQLQALATQVLSRTSLSRIINDPRLLLYKNELSTKPLEDVIEEMQGHLAIAAINKDAHYFSISFEYADRFKTQQTVQALMNAIDEANQTSPLTSASAALPFDWGQLSVQSAPSLDNDPIAPNRLVIAGMGGGVGLLLAALISIIRNRWNPEDEIPIDAVNG